MSDTTATDTSTLPDPLPTRPALGIRHILLWTACSAAYLAVNRLALNAGDPERAGIYAGFTIISSFDAGLSLVGLVLLADSIWRRVRFPTYAGEILLVILGLNTVGNTARWIGFLLRYYGEPWDPFWPSAILVPAYLILFGAWVWLLVATIRRRTWYWRCLFIALLTEPVGYKVLSCAGGPFIGVFISMTVTPLLLGIFLIIVIVRDSRRQPRLPWTHWAGIFCCGCQILVRFVSTAFNWLSFSSW